MVPINDWLPFVDQVSDLSQKLTTQLDSRLIGLERKLENLNAEMKGIQVSFL